MSYYCVCNNCDTLLLDTNPSEGSISVTEPEDTLPSLIHIDQVAWFVCPICKVDDYLTDITSKDEFKRRLNNVEQWKEE